jgi:hypothetical protein
MTAGFVAVEGEPDELAGIDGSPKPPDDPSFPFDAGEGALMQPRTGRADRRGNGRLGRA